ncbi:LysM peptidoglycan-binding domain-containing protein [Shinella yambaruensis]|nr:LysM peptidoglycan-binding domain-containing protein [Shinella yambaruensis]MCJ8029924.1 LysM peptidoglycan-binding domain-containing protein [Shinella yambaruensis]MCU7984179.1 LysM peptidoglycan-binding domain-containing protein [Shinella yambaruensis]
MMKNKTGLVALIVLAAATLLMVFFVLPNMNKDKPAETPVATLTTTTTQGGGETTTADGKQARSTTATGEAATGDGATGDAAAGTEGEKPADATAGEAATATQEIAKAETTPADPAAGWVTPAFDLLRVEPDGSTVIAGRGQPNTTLEIRNGETVVATADIGPSGDFAAVFEQPLAAGDYQLTLSTKDDKGASKTSEEVATVSVPKDAGGDLLAMVSRPGEASRLITVPEAAEKAAGAAEKTIDQPAGETAAASDTGAAGAVADEKPAASETAEAAGETAATAGEAATAGAAATETANGTAGTAATETAAKPQARVSAVELEGERMFIAGTAKPGALVRIYADDQLVGEAKADGEGRYVADGTIDLSVGRHTIRADVMSPDGGKVEFRASVPFDRPEGEQVAVVAQEDAAGDTGPALGLIGGGTFDKLRAEADKAVALLKGLYADGRVPTAEELAAARSATEIALKSLAEFKPGLEEGEAARDMAARASAAAASALARLQALPKDAAAVGGALASIETAVADALAPAIEKAEAVVGAASAAADSSIEALAGQATALQQQFVALFSDGRNATTAEIQTARTALEGALKGITGFTPPAGTAADVTAAIEKLKGWASTALDRLAAVPAGAGKEAYQQALVALEGMPSLTAAASAVAAAGEGAASATGAASTAETATADNGTASAEGTPAATGGESGTAASGEAAATGSGQAVAEEPETVEQAPLQESKTSVIIRRGDTLWQISRRIYGKGVRYTTIYLANEDQITDPDRIIPGQVFGVPDKTVESDAEAEELHRKRVRGD